MIDLDRLREAMWDIDCPEEHGLLVEAVLDAPTVWWCMEHDMPVLDFEHEACPYGQRSKHRGWDCDVRPGVWVPVSGGEG